MFYKGGLGTSRVTLILEIRVVTRLLYITLSTHCPIESQTLSRTYMSNYKTNHHFTCKSHVVKGFILDFRVLEDFEFPDETYEATSNYESLRA